MSTLNLVARSCLAVEIWQEIYSGRPSLVPSSLFGFPNGRDQLNVIIKLASLGIIHISRHTSVTAYIHTYIIYTEMTLLHD